MYLIEKFDNRYRITENSEMSEIFKEKIEKFLIEPILERLEKK